MRDRGESAYDAPTTPKFAKDHRDLFFPGALSSPLPLGHGLSYHPLGVQELQARALYEPPGKVARPLAPGYQDQPLPRRPPTHQATAAAMAFLPHTGTPQKAFLPHTGTPKRPSYPLTGLPSPSQVPPKGLPAPHRYPLKAFLPPHRYPLKGLPAPHRYPPKAFLPPHRYPPKPTVHLHAVVSPEEGREPSEGPSYRLQESHLCQRMKMATVSPGLDPVTGWFHEEPAPTCSSGTATGTDQQHHYAALDPSRLVDPARVRSRIPPNMPKLFIPSTVTKFPPEITVTPPTPTLLSPKGSISEETKQRLKNVILSSQSAATVKKDALSQPVLEVQETSSQESSLESESEEEEDDDEDEEGEDDYMDI
ncbi:unnamed protein product [Arctogadus glacialis]